MSNSSSERKLGPWTVPAIGLGCMNLSHAYGVPPSMEQSEAVLQKALDLGITHFDSAALYGFGHNEELVGPFLKTCRDRIVLVSKGGMRGFLTSVDQDPSEFADKDIRRGMPRFQEPHFSENRKLLPEYRAIADEAGCTPAQLALAWVLHHGDYMHVLPGTTSVEHLEEDIAALDVDISSEIVASLDALINQQTVSGPRYPAPTQAEIDTEEFE